ncbi:hypothetical protein GQ53DRAFT_367030 [Thozetella sp. PMI_491]|nr:hypothetical protein GQ53DRAFT_367030 [Thozetella sp. PMI_491]
MAPETKSTAQSRALHLLVLRTGWARKATSAVIRHTPEARDPCSSLPAEACAPLGWVASPPTLRACSRLASFASSHQKPGGGSDFRQPALFFRSRHSSCTEPYCGIENNGLNGFFHFLPRAILPSLEPPFSSQPVSCLCTCTTPTYAFPPIAE